MTNEELKTKLTDLFKNYHEASPSDLMYQEYDDDLFHEHDIVIENVDSYGGEDCGSEYYATYKFTSDGAEVHATFSGWYASYCGADFDSWSFVKPIQVMKTEYVQDED
ncbi:MAG: hypothetical protein PF440_06825 [Thiomicrorhabdus sp.]|jgi:hypothetical protein|nr:hypothetical protein [Thiomicrorhabdus sp.]